MGHYLCSDQRVIEHRDDDNSKGRTLHWVIRNTDLMPSLKFWKNVFGLCTLRHEENAEPCQITCNGRYNNAWSKTMIGYDTEDKCYALEVTYNYGIYSYKKGNGLQTIGMKVDDIEASLKAANDLGLQV